MLAYQSKACAFITKHRYSRYKLSSLPFVLDSLNTGLDRVIRLLPHSSVSASAVFIGLHGFVYGAHSGFVLNGVALSNDHYYYQLRSFVSRGVLLIQESGLTLSFINEFRAFLTYLELQLTKPSLYLGLNLTKFFYFVSLPNGKYLYRHPIYGLRKPRFTNKLKYAKPYHECLK